MEFIERNVQRGLVVMDSTEPQRWRPVENILRLDLPKSDPRGCFFVHGTFQQHDRQFWRAGCNTSGDAPFWKLPERIMTPSSDSITRP